jgi:hypothetical protein
VVLTVVLTMVQTMVVTSTVVTIQRIPLLELTQYVVSLFPKLKVVYQSYQEFGKCAGDSDKMSFMCG